MAQLIDMVFSKGGSKNMHEIGSELKSSIAILNKIDKRQDVTKSSVPLDNNFSGDSENKEHLRFWKWG